MDRRRERARQVERLKKSIGYAPDNRKWFINRRVEGINFRMYSFYKERVLDYVESKYLRLCE